MPQLSREDALTQTGRTGLPCAPI